MNKIKITSEKLHGFIKDSVVTVNDHQAAVILSINAGELIQEQEQEQEQPKPATKRGRKPKAE